MATPRRRAATLRESENLHRCLPPRAQFQRSRHGVENDRFRNSPRPVLGAKPSTIQWPPEEVRRRKSGILVKNVESPAGLAEHAIGLAWREPRTRGATRSWWTRQLPSYPEPRLSGNARSDLCKTRRQPVPASRACPESASGASAHRQSLLRDGPRRW